MNFSGRASFTHLVNLRLKLSIILADILSRRTLRVTLHDSHHHPSLHRSQISENFAFKEHVIDAGSGSRIRQLGQPILLLFGEKNSQQCVSIVSF
jgi:hypothetical protein